MALASLVRTAFDDAPPTEPPVQTALQVLAGWDGDMALDSAPATVIALLYKHLFHELFADELGAELTKAIRQRGNHSAVMMGVALAGDGTWWDRTDTPNTETRAVILRAALRKAADELKRLLGDDPADWGWGRLHQVRLRHPVGQVGLLGLLFNEGPLGLPGHAQTVNKAQFLDHSYQVYLGPSMRQVTDMARPARAWGVLPSGQSGIPASPHYTDLRCRCGGKGATTRC